MTKHCKKPRIKVRIQRSKHCNTRYVQYFWATDHKRKIRSFRENTRNFLMTDSISCLRKRSHLDRSPIFVRFPLRVEKETKSVDVLSGFPLIQFSFISKCIFTVVASAPENSGKRLWWYSLQQVARCTLWSSLQSSIYSYELRFLLYF